MTLVALDADQIRSLHATGHAMVDGVQIGWDPDDVHNLRHRVHALDLDEASAPYLVHVSLDGARVRARIGCHSAPHDAEVEIGYFVAPEDRGRGGATTMVAEFLDWLQRRGIERVRASIAPDNAASLALVSRLGFAHVGELVDEDDGERLLSFVRHLSGLRPWSEE